jgi:L,D-peptidoglycan transpeptidase YkuD (ErfK/YbiS/YcfS/YnhG family)
VKKRESFSGIAPKVFKQSAFEEAGLTRNQKSRGIGIIDVRAKPGHKTRGLLAAGNLVLECALGKGGISAFKREGDGATPLSSMRLLYGYRRGDAGSCLHPVCP